MTDPEFSLRAFKPSDLPALLAMVRALCDQHEAWDPARFNFVPDIEARYARWLPLRAADPDSVLLIAAQAEPLGFLVGEILDDIPIFNTARYGFIHDVFVRPDARKQGIAAALVQAAVAQFNARGIRQVRLDTACQNESARKVFASVGFRSSIVQMLHETPRPASQSEPSV